MDAEKRYHLIETSERSFAFLVNPATHDLEFIRLDDGVASIEDALLAIKRRRLQYAGTLGFVDGEPRVVMHTAFDERTTIALGRAVAVFVNVLLGDGAREPQDDFSSFMTGLYRLEDTRV
jgi:hypothetical protein